MKVLIWVLTIFIGTIINTFIGAITQVRAGAVLLYLVEAYIANKLCQKWEIRRNKKENTKQRKYMDGGPVVPLESGSKTSSSEQNSAGDNSTEDPMERKTLSNSEIWENIENSYKTINIQLSSDLSDSNNKKPSEDMQSFTVNNQSVSEYKRKKLLSICLIIASALIITSVFGNVAQYIDKRNALQSRDDTVAEINELLQQAVNECLEKDELIQELKVTVSNKNKRNAELESELLDINESIFDIGTLLKNVDLGYYSNEFRLDMAGKNVIEVPRNGKQTEVNLITSFGISVNYKNIIIEPVFCYSYSYGSNSPVSFQLDSNPWYYSTTLKIIPNYSGIGIYRVRYTTRNNGDGIDLYSIKNGIKEFPIIVIVE